MSALLRDKTNGQRSYAVAASIVLLAWLALAVWSMSPYAAWLDHTELEEITEPATVRLAVFTLGWALMITAMMLPSTLLFFVRCLENKPLAARRIVPAILAYLVVWMIFGGLSYLGDGALHEFVEQTPALSGVIAPGVLMLAGIYQLTPMKRVCLSRCRAEGTAFSVLNHSSRQEGWTLGLRQGVYCLGSCWALMLLMFATGGINLLWMLVLGVLVTAERSSRQGTLLAQAMGILLILASVVLVFT